MGEFWNMQGHWVWNETVKSLKLKSVSIIVLLVSILVLLGGYANKANEKPNVIVIFIDDMGYADLSCFGNPVVKTPNIDALAQQGIKFTNFYVNSPICSPSRVALFTGCYPMRFKIHSYLDGSIIQGLIQAVQ